MTDDRAADPRPPASGQGGDGAPGQAGPESSSGSSSRRNILIGVAVLVGVLVVAGGVLLFSYLSGDEPDPVSLEGAIGSEGEETTAGDTAGGEDVAAASATVDGTWVVDETGESFVGYRIGEEIAGIGSKTTVGRTGEVTATVTLNGTVVETLEVEADMTSLESDDGRRDRQLRSRGLETDDFPSATFVAGETVDIGEVPGDGEPITLPVTGDFTLHGVTNEVTLELEAQRDGAGIVAVGSLPVALADYDIEKPVGFSILGIEDDGTAEFQLVLVKQ